MKKFLTVLLLGVYLLLSACSTGTQAPKTVLELVNGDQVVSLTMDQLKALPAVEGWSGVRSSDGVITAPTRYKGVPLRTLLNQNGGIGQGRSLEVFNEDGYAITLDPGDIFDGNYITYDVTTGDEIETHGTLLTIVAYEREGQALSFESEGPLRLVMISETPLQVVDEYMSVKGITQLKLKYFDIIRERDGWTVDLIGAVSEPMSLATFDSGAAPYCHMASWTDDKGHFWSGIPLYYLIGRVDDDKKHGENGFRDDLAQAGYTIDVISANGYKVTLDSRTVMRNDNIIVANHMDGEDLSGEDFPLHLVGSYLSKKQMVGGISKIVINFPTGIRAKTSTETQAPMGEIPAVRGPDKATVTLIGLIDDEKTLTVDDLIAFGVVNTTLEHPMEGDMKVTGVPFNKVLASVSIKPMARTIAFIQKDGFTLYVSLADLQACDRCLLGWNEEMFNAYLPGFELTFWAEGLNTIIFE